MSRKKNKRKKQKVSSGSRRRIKGNVPLNRFPFDVGSELKKAFQHHQSGQLQKAEKIYKKILKIQPHHSESLHLLAVINHQCGKTDIAVNLFNKVIQNDPKNPISHYSLGAAFQDQGKLDEAISCYQKALKLRPDLVEAYNNMGNALRYQGKLAEAIAFFQHALKLDPEHFSAKHHLAAMTGQATEVAPREYIRNLFDKYSIKFDRHLVEALDYKIPSLLRRKFCTVVKNDRHFKNVIDLGCGTGLAGMEFRVVADRLSGIDISPKMIEEAKKNLFTISYWLEIL